MNIETFASRLVETRDLSAWVRHFVFERVDQKPMTFAPGQWFNLFLPHEGQELRRPYSIASHPDGSARFELTVTRVPGGPGSEALHAMPLGTEVRTVGPHGLFIREADDPRPALFVGTGAGLAPLRSMLKAALAAPSHPKMTLLFGVRSEADILYRQEIESWAKERASIRVHVTLSRPDADWTGKSGYVQQHLDEAWNELAEPEAHVFICGLDKMVKDVRERSKGELGVPRRHVHIERFD
ncbi:MAG: FAD-dependent oxidoreductase [Polyangiaceae bacterium]|nr:FAD-dependent oxidoreductase [Polyangiaceae bacterium]